MSFRSLKQRDISMTIQGFKVVGFAIAAVVLVVFLCTKFRTDRRDSRIESHTTMLIAALQGYKAETGTYPPGDSRDIGNALFGRNAQKIIYYETANRYRTPEGDILDPYGTPYRFYFSGDHVLIRSAGRNKRFEDGTVERSDDYYRTDDSNP